MSSVQYYFSDAPITPLNPVRNKLNCFNRKYEYNTNYDCEDEFDIIQKVKIYNHIQLVFNFSSEFASSM